MTTVKYFDGRETGNNGLYIQPHDTIFINAYLDDIDKKKVLYHEMGHVGQCLESYDRLKEKQEIQANKYMVKNLLNDYLKELDELGQFNMTRFMDYYRLHTTVDEAVILDEIRKLVGN
ncbi:M78 family metallopeptidase domain-containing protein [Streptococcus dysgalactiae]|uniref:ImmA/IrrE family metallo-endopeptidase n=1 Tax=Streptococcus dysgalactiae TaxID=1334 RepID=UPI000DCA976A|nr:ImmA/IrrE family metallo-endopeptidase [Streptococcus dysgalactiae]WCE85951.1 ImmA/IrrE family metallo-endopeptidase [Streptococcus dysgalactiae]WCN25947.1 ImmA/IrrE family metallo-endopeptidase [Streptococcus dysgalactiae]BBE40610.1 hypothetical protein FGCSD_1385 [Streptococcus dysgalactiae]